MGAHGGVDRSGLRRSAVMSKKISVAVNMLWCVAGKVGGSEEYLVRQLSGLGAIESPYAVTLYVPRGFSSAHPDLREKHRFVEAPSDCRRRETRVLLENTWLVGKARGSDVVHHGGGTLPTRTTGATLLTVHDVQYLTYPEYFSNYKLRYLRNRVPSSLRRSNAVAVPSAYVASTLADSFGVSPEKIHVVRHGVSSTLGANATPEAELRSRFDLGTGDVLFMPAITHPHKNHEFLLRMMSAHWSDPNLRLVLAGGEGRAEAFIQRQVVDLGLQDRVVRIGRVGADDRDGLIKMSLAVVFPSSYEGFGAPVLEAMKLGTPVIASDQAAAVEVLGGSGLNLPLHVAAWADALDVVRAQRAEMTRHGIQRATQYTDTMSAQDLCRAYAGALSAQGNLK